MVYTYEMWDQDGKEVSVGLYETGARPSEQQSRDIIPVEVGGRTYVLDSDDLLLKAQAFFRRKYADQGDDFYLRWASILTFCRENAAQLSTSGVVQVREGEMVGIDANFVRMLLASYSPSPLVGGFPISTLHEGEAGFSVVKCLDAWRSGKYFEPVEDDPSQL